MAHGARYHGDIPPPHHFWIPEWPPSERRNWVGPHLWHLRLYATSTVCNPQKHRKAGGTPPHSPIILSSQHPFVARGLPPPNNLCHCWHHLHEFARYLDITGSYVGALALRGVWQQLKKTFIVMTPLNAHLRKDHLILECFFKASEKAAIPATLTWDKQVCKKRDLLLNKYA